MKQTLQTIALGGGCHWCTEAVFEYLKGVQAVEQGFVAGSGKHQNFSEAVVVHFDPSVISLKRIIEIHLHTHNSTSNHSMRDKYRSAIYFYSREQERLALGILKEVQEQFPREIITQVLAFSSFTPSAKQYRNYYAQNPQKPFCKRYIDPKLKLLLSKFPNDIDAENIL